MKALKSEILSHITDEVLNNIINNYTKCVGVECKSDVLNQNNKNIGRTLLIYYADIIPENKRKKYLLLNQFVEFLPEKILWSALRLDNGYSVKTGFHIIDPYFVKPYNTDIKIEVPITIYNAKTGKLEFTMMEKTYKQFTEHRLNLIFVAKEKEWPYKYINAYNNFRNMFASTGQYYLAINSTVKHCWITQAELVSIIGRVDNLKKRILNEWNKYLNDKLSYDATFKEVYKINQSIENESEVCTQSKIRSIK
jgi:hypothetical protein